MRERICDGVERSIVFYILYSLEFLVVLLNFCNFWFFKIFLREKDFVKWEYYFFIFMYIL